jgi:hypothetical protein
MIQSFLSSPESFKPILHNVQIFLFFYFFIFSNRHNNQKLEDSSQALNPSQQFGCVQGQTNSEKGKILVKLWTLGHGILQNMFFPITQFLRQERYAQNSCSITRITHKVTFIFNKHPLTILYKRISVLLLIVDKENDKKK